MLWHFIDKIEHLRYKHEHLLMCLMLLASLSFAATFTLAGVLTGNVIAQTCNTGDGNGDGKVDGFDYVIWWQNFNTNVSGAANGDYNCSGNVDGFDYVIWWQNFGNSVGTTPTPTSQPGNVNLNPFGSVSISSAETEFNVNGSGSNVDSIAFWEASDATQSLMFVTSKNNSSVEVYRYPFTSQLRTISCGSTSNGVWVDQERDVLYVTQPNTNNVCAYDLPGLGSNSSLSFTTSATGGRSEPNLTLLKQTNGQRRIYVSYDFDVYYHDAGNGNALGHFKPIKGLETMYADEYYQRIYIPDENGRSGVYMYDASGNSVGSKFGDSSIFDADEEGIWVYKCPSTGTADNGEGLIVVSDQKASLTDFEVFNRKTKQYLGKINIEGVNNTDGIAITQQSFSAYPLGLLAVIDNDTSAVGVGWDTILTKTGMSCGN